jgi:hypothetical protein
MDAAKEAQRALEVARRMRGPARERASTIRELERKLEHVKRTAAAAAGSSAQAEDARIQAADRLTAGRLGVPARATYEASGSSGGQAQAPDLNSRIDQVGGTEAISRHAERSRMKEDASRRLGHAYTRHVDVSDVSLEKRVDPQEKQETKGPDHSTRWRSDEAIVVANAVLWANAAAQDRRKDIEDRLAAGEPVDPQFAVHASLTKIFGAGWRAHVDGLSRSPSGPAETSWADDGQAIAVYRRQDDGIWNLVTCYPSPDPLPDV